LKETLLGYSSFLNESGYSASTINSKVSQIKNVLKKEEKVFIDMTEVYAFINSLMDDHETKKASTFSSSEIIQLIKRLTNKPSDLLKKICLLFGVYGACRISQLDKIYFSDLKFLKDGVEVTVPVCKRKQKVGPKRKPKKRTFFVPSSKDEELSILKILENYYKLLKDGKIIMKGKFWKQIKDEDQQNEKFTNQNYGIHKLEKITKELAQELGKEDWESYTSHGLKRSSITLSIENGLSDRLVQVQGEFSNTSVIKEYYDQSKQTKEIISEKILDLNKINSNEPTKKKEEKDFYFNDSKPSIINYGTINFYNKKEN